MRILNWVQSKISSRTEKKRPDAVPVNAVRYDDANRKEEFNDWPQGLLAIGTFGNSNLKEGSDAKDLLQSPSLPQDLPDFTPEEVSKLQAELTRLLSVKVKPDACEPKVPSGGEGLPPDRSSNRPPRLEIDRAAASAACGNFSEYLEEVDGDDGELSPNAKIILNRVRDVIAENRSSFTRQSFSFLVKKMFACRGGFAPVPSLRDPLPEPRMEKLMKALLHKKIYPHNSGPIPVKKYLEKKPVSGKNDDKIQEKADDGCKWVKTDSEYIVLEI